MRLILPQEGPAIRSLNLAIFHMPGVEFPRKVDTLFDEHETARLGDLSLQAVENSHPGLEIEFVRRHWDLLMME